MKGTGSKNAWALFLLLLAGIVLGGFIGMLAEGFLRLTGSLTASPLGWTSLSCWNLGVLVVTFGLSIKITIKYYWRDSFDFNLSLLIIKYDELVR